MSAGDRPHTAAWSGTSSTVARALRLIDGGALDGDGSVEDLASRLGMGARQLRRLFQEHLAASPISLAQTRRAHFARNLLEQTGLGLDQIAMASGFGSVRRFRAVMQRTFGESPSALRGTKPKPAQTQLRLPLRPPFDFAHLLTFLGARAIDGVEEVSPKGYRRLVVLGKHRGHIEVSRPDEKYLLLEADASLTPVLLSLTERVRALFDLNADPGVIDSALAEHPLLAKSVKRHPGTRTPGAFDAFETSLRAVVGQQVSVKAANTLMGRLCKGRTLTPRSVARSDLGALGMPGARIETLRRVATVFADRTPELDELGTIKGIGPWTLGYLGMRVYRDPDAFPAGDLVLRRSASQGAQPLSASALKKLAEPWRPWRAYAAMHLWRMES